MLLLKRTGCPTLRAGNSGGGSGTFIHVLGAITSSGLSDARYHPRRQRRAQLLGRQQHQHLRGRAERRHRRLRGAAAEQSPRSRPAEARTDHVRRQAGRGFSGGVIRDGLDYVYGSSALSGSGGTKNEVVGAFADHPKAGGRALFHRRQRGHLGRGDGVLGSGRRPPGRSTGDAERLHP